MLFWSTIKGLVTVLGNLVSQPDLNKQQRISVTSKATFNRMNTSSEDRKAAPSTDEIYANYLDY